MAGPAVAPSTRGVGVEQTARRGRCAGLTAPPRRGQHTGEVLTALGVDADTLVGLRADGAVR